MDLSDEQLNAAQGGTTPSTWADVPLPTGRQTLPDWVRGAEVTWMHGWASRPTVSLRTTMPYNGYSDWPNEVWTKEERPGLYMTRHPDGRAQILSHRGEITPSVAWRVFAGNVPLTFQWIVPEVKDGETIEQAARREGEENMARHLASNSHTDMRGRPYDPATVRLELKHLGVAPKDRGFGGDSYLITMADGTERLLRGPWSGSTPPGYVQTHNSGSSMITEDLFLRIVATYLPHLRVARVNGALLELYKPEWGVPRDWVFEQERLRADQGLPAGPHWYVYWGNDEPGSLKHDGPKFGIDMTLGYEG